MQVNITNKLYPNDYNKNVGTLAIKFPMNANLSNNESTLFNMSKTTEEQAISNYINLLLTKDGERYMQPKYGVGLWYYVFEQSVISLEVELDAKIREQSSYWLPYIVNDNIFVQSTQQTSGDEHGIIINIQFRVYQQWANRTISIFNGNEQELNIEVS